MISTCGEEIGVYTQTNITCPCCRQAKMNAITPKDSTDEWVDCPLCGLKTFKYQFDESGIMPRLIRVVINYIRYLTEGASSDSEKQRLLNIIKAAPSPS